MPFALDFDTLIKLVAPLLVALIGGVVKRIVERKPKLITYLVHAASHPLPPSAPAPAAAPAPPPNQQVAVENAQAEMPPRLTAVHTHSVVVRNTGKRSAHNVRIDHAVFPLSYQIYPPVHHTVTRGQGGSAEICIPVLVPNEQVTLSYLYFPPLLWSQVVGPVKCDEAMAKAIQTIPTSPPPRAVIWLTWIFIFVGASTTVYWLLKLLPLLLR